MNHRLTYIFYAMIAIGLFFCGIWIGEEQGRNRKENTESITMTKPFEITLKKEKKQKEEMVLNSAEETPFLEKLDFGWELEESKMISDYELTEEETRFLKDHLFGRWNFSERVVELGGEKNGEKTESNFSTSGVDTIQIKPELPYRVRSQTKPHISYGREMVIIFFHKNSSLFCDSQDVFLYGLYGGFAEVTFPAYSIEVMETDHIFLDDIYSETGYYEAQVEGMEGFVHVSYSRLDSKETMREIGYYPANDIYIDPNNTEIIYIDFCGLWKMERARSGEGKG